MQKQRLELDWIGKDEEPKLEPRILIEQTSFSYGEKSANCLIHGDNLLALKALESNFTNTFKCIYIDPPYNTGTRINADGNEIGYDDGLEHSAWLNMMKPRLNLLYKLLHEDGLLAIQIDDNEYARLYLLLIEIFGTDRCLKTIVVKMSEPSGLKMSSVNKNGTIPKLKEYIILAKKKGVSGVFFEKLKKEKWDDEYNIFFDNFSKEDRDALNELMQKDLFTELDVKAADSILKKINLISVSEKMNSLRLNKSASQEWLFENAWRIAQCATSSSVLRAAQKKIEAAPQKDVFAVLGARLEQIYLVRNGWSDTSKKPRVQLIFADDNLYVHPGDLWTDIKTTGLEAEGGISFKNGKKPELLVERIIAASTKTDDWVLDSFAGSGTTAAVAHKMRRKWITIEMGPHCTSHTHVRIKNVIDGSDNIGISQKYKWTGGGGFKFYELAPSLLQKDNRGNWIISPKYNAIMLAEAVCKHEGFKFWPDQNLYWKQGHSSEKDFIFVTTEFLTAERLEKISSQLKPDESLLICAKAFKVPNNKYTNITMKKIPQMLLGRCEFGRDDYSLNVKEAVQDEMDLE